MRNLLYESWVGPTWVFSDEAGEVLNSLWDDAAAIVEESERREPQGLEAGRLYKEGQYTIRIIRCPKPNDIAENHFVAVACKPARGQILSSGRRPEEVRYLAGLRCR